MDTQLITNLLHSTIQSRMEIEITMQEPKSNNTIMPVMPDIADVADMPVMPDIAVAENSVETPETIEKPKKVLSQEDITTIVDNVLSNFIDYLSENTEFSHMQDEIINKRMRVIMKEKFNVMICKNISEFIIFLDEDENIQEYIAENGKITYDSVLSEDIHTYIYEYLYGETCYADDMAHGWLNWDERKGKYCNYDSFDIKIQDFLLNKIVKYVFQQYGDGYEFIDSKEKGQEHNSDSASEDADKDNSGEDESNITDYDEVKQKNECNIN